MWTLSEGLCRIRLSLRGAKKMGHLSTDSHLSLVDSHSWGVFFRSLALLASPVYVDHILVVRECFHEERHGNLLFI